MRMRSAILLLAVPLILAPCLAAEQSKPPAKQQTIFTNKPFDVNVEKLPKDFGGTDPVGLFQALLKKPEPIKQEFETTDQFTDRHNKWLSHPLIGSVTPTSLIALAFRPSILPSNQASFKYNADTGEMMFSLSPGRCGGLNNLTVLSTSKDLGSYVGQNAFGVKKVIKKFAVTRFCLIGVPNIQISFPVLPEQARLEKQLARFVLIGTLRSPYTEIVTDYDKPTLDSPEAIHWTDYVLNFNVEEVWIFSGLTGITLHRPLYDEGVVLQRDENGNNGLHLAIWHGETRKALRIIHGRSVNLNDTNKFGATPLHLAVAKGDVKVTQALIDAGVSTNVTDNDGVTPAMDAQKRGYRAILELLDKASIK